MAIELTDDGTLDTVLRCSECGEEMRYTYMPDDVPTGEEEDAYDAFIAWAIEDATADHECYPGDREPQEGDIVTSDHRRFYSDGKLIVIVDADDWMPAVGAWCKANQYFPNVFFISDHGNSVLISVTPDGRYLGGFSE